MFIMVLALNVASYYTIVQISEVYTERSSGLVNLKMKIFSADMYLREILAGSTEVKPADIWKELDQAEELVSSALKLPGDSPIVEELKGFRQFLVSTLFNENAGDESLVQKPESSGFMQDYGAIFNSLIRQIDRYEGGVRESVSDRMRTYKTIYGLVLASISILFAIMILAVARYAMACRLAEKAIPDMKASIDVIINSVQFLLITVDQEMKITHLNGAACKYLGVKAEKAVGAGLAETAPMLEPFAAEITKVCFSGKPAEFHREKILFSTGEERCYNISVNPLKYGAGGASITIEDITAQEIRDEQARQSQKMMLVESTIENLANDFNNVLGAVNASVNMMEFMLEKEMPRPADLKNSLEIIKGSIERAVVMVHQLSSFSGRKELVLSPVDLNRSVRNVLNICEKSFDKRVTIKVELPNQRAMVKADPALLELAFLNICENAAHAMTIMRPAEDKNRWGGAIKVSVNNVFPDNAFKTFHPAATQRSYWALAVSDCGVGISHDDMPRIFDPMFSTKGTKTGMGFGLSTIREIVEQHKGFVDINSVHGEGTTVTLYLPEVEEEPPKTDKAKAGGEPPPSIPVGSGLVLVVDDEEILRKTARSVLSKLGYETIFAENGLQAIEVYGKRWGEIKAVLLDLSMPKMNGRDALPELLKINPEARIIVVSGMETDRRIGEMLSLGAKAYVPKPYSMVSLAQELNKICKDS